MGISSILVHERKRPINDSRKCDIACLNIIRLVFDKRKCYAYNAADSEPDADAGKLSIIPSHIQYQILDFLTARSLPLLLPRHFHKEESHVSVEPPGGGHWPSKDTCIEGEEAV